MFQIIAYTDLVLRINLLVYHFVFTRYMLTFYILFTKNGSANDIMHLDLILSISFLVLPL